MNLELAYQDVSLQVGEVLDGENASSTLDESHSMPIIPTNSTPPSKEPQNWRLATPTALLSLLATVLSISRIFGCLLELGYSPMMASGVHGRMLSLAESGSFKRCMEGGRSRVATPISPLLPGSPSQRRGAIAFPVFPTQETNFNEDDHQGLAPKQAVEEVEQHATLKQSVEGVEQHDALKQTEERKGQRAWVEQDQEGGEQHATLKQPLEGGGQLASHFKKTALFNVTTALQNIPEEAELRRLQEALLAPVAESNNLTTADMKLLREAKHKLGYMMKKRSRLATALRKRLEERQRLAAYELKLSSNMGISDLQLGRLRQFVYVVVSSALKKKIRAVNKKISRLERKLTLFRGALKTLLSNSQQLAIALRLAARRRQSGQAITVKEANALSIAKLVMNGFRKRNCLLSPTEGTEVLKMGSELSADVNDAVVVLSSLMEKVRSDSGCGGCPSCIHLKEYLPRCSALQKEAAMFALQLRSVKMTSAPEMLKGILTNIEQGVLQLRRKLEVATQFLPTSPC